MKIIFLDFDGVIDRYDEPESFLWLSPRCVENLNCLLDRCESKIVISSTWRELHPIPELKQILINAGLKCPDKVIGRTPWIPGSRRGTEIELWLKNTEELIESFVILDDDSDMEPFMDRLVNTDFNVGLTMDDVEKAIILLDQSWKRCF